MCLLFVTLRSNIDILIRLVPNTALAIDCFGALCRAATLYDPFLQRHVTDSFHSYLQNRNYQYLYGFHHSHLNF